VFNIYKYYVDEKSDFNIAMCCTLSFSPVQNGDFVQYKKHSTNPNAAWDNRAMSRQKWTRGIVTCKLNDKGNVSVKLQKSGKVVSVNTLMLVLIR
jgi:hypothetical protein